MMETDHLNEAHGIGQADGSPSHPSGKPMRQLEFNQAMSDFRHMFPETDEEVIEAVLRANSGMVDATIDQLLTMNIDAQQVRDMYDHDESGDQLSDHILLSVEQEVLAQEQQASARESRLKKRQQAGDSTLEKASRKDLLEDCPPSYTEAVKSHLSHSHHHHPRGNSNHHRHRHSPTSGGSPSANTSPKSNTATSGVTSRSSGSGSSGHHHHHHHHRHSRSNNNNGMQHLLDLGPESAPGGAALASTTAATTNASNLTEVKQQLQQSLSSQHASGGGSSKFHSHHHSQRASSSSNHHHHHHRRRGDSMDSASPHHKSRPGRNLLASNSMSSSHHPFSSSNPAGHQDELGLYPSRPRKSSLDSGDLCMDASGREKSPSRWHSSYRERTSPKRPAFRNWNPPMLGTLPDDFLRITPVIQSATPTPVSYRANKPGNTHLHRAMSAVGPERPKVSPSHAMEPKTPSAMSTSLLSSSSSSASSKPKSSHKPHRSLSFAGHSAESSMHQRKSKQPHPSGLAQHEFSQDFLQERMKENELRRLRMGSSGLDPELAQYLADERLAIMLQNSEFLQELRLDHQFMMTLERDHKDVEEGNTVTEVGPPEPLAMSGLQSDEEEGYGEDRRDTLEAFPFTQQLPPSTAKSEDVELRKKLKHMGKASKKQFAALARKFFAKRKKKTAHQILKESQAPSMMNLLDDEDEDPEFDDLVSGDHYSSSGQYDQETPSSKFSSWNERHRYSDNL